MADTRTREEALAFDAENNYCPCGAYLRGEPYESSPGWWAWGRYLPGVVVVYIDRLGRSPPHTSLKRRFCAKCAVVVTDMLVEKGLR